MWNPIDVSQYNEDSKPNCKAAAFRYSVNDSGICITKYTGPRKVVIMPGMIEDKPVTEIAQGAFADNKTVECVILPESVVTVGAAAFKGCAHLQKVHLPVELTEIPESCFESCWALREVKLPCALKKIYRYAFRGCRALTTLKHNPKNSIGGLMTDIEDEELPIKLSVIGRGAFAGCKSLKQVVLPYKVTKIARAAFKNCTSLEYLTLHNRITSIMDNAFEGCTELKTLRIPSSVSEIADSAFEGTDMTLICDEHSYAHQFVQEKEMKHELIGESRVNVDMLSSQMIPCSSAEEYKPFLSEEQKSELCTRIEVRAPFRHTLDRAAKYPTCSASRYKLVDGVYEKIENSDRNHMTIRMTGDLMCKKVMQQNAVEGDGFDFNSAYKHVRTVLSDSDLTIGNLESMICRSYPLSVECEYINDRPYLNAPEEYLAAAKNAGFDVVVNAQNHIYDAGARGILETLEAMNRHRLMHTGAFAGPDDSRYLLIKANNICIAVMAYFDANRQAMKKANFTEFGLENIINYYSAEKVQKDVAEAKAHGAEFVIAYCHWGREYTEELTERQLTTAQEVADAGVDYIFGSHSHCLQRYDVLKAADGRKVPCLYSGGNFLSDLSIKRRMTRDTIVASLELTKNDEGKVEILKDGYYPYRVLVRGEDKLRYVLVPTDMVLNKNLENRVLTESEAHIDNVMGAQYTKLKSRSAAKTAPAKKTATEAAVEEAKAPVTETVNKTVENPYAIKEPMIIKVNSESTRYGSRFSKNGSGVYESCNDLGSNEAVIICGGQIEYDKELGEYAKFDTVYNFYPYFKFLKKCVAKADLAVAGFSAMCCDYYLSTEMMDDKYAPIPGYSNARKEYLDAVRYAGFDVLAAANVHNLDVGVNGIDKTASAICDAGMLPLGISREKSKLFCVNGINIGMLSYTLKCRQLDEVITAEGAEKLLSVYSKAGSEADIRALRDAGADFILTYVNCDDIKTSESLEQRKKAAEELSENGVDYVICTAHGAPTEFYRCKTRKGRTVPVASSLGSLVTGRFGETPGDELGAMLKLTLYKTPEKIEISDEFIPLKRFEVLDRMPMPVVPAMPAYYSGYSLAQFSGVRAGLVELLGKTIPASKDRVVKIGTGSRPQLTYQQIYDILGAAPSDADKKKLDLTRKAPFICCRRADLRLGGVAVMVNIGGYKKDEFQISIQDAVKAKVDLLVATQPHEEIPTIVVGNCIVALKKLMNAVRAQYKPKTVVVTGTAGKTTTKELLGCVFDTHYRTLHVEGNYNTLWTASNIIQKLSKEDKAYIQEVHGGSVGSAMNVSRLAKPDIAIITNIGAGHLMNMGTMENVIKGKLQIVAGLKEGGALVVNDDNEYLHDLTPNHPDFEGFGMDKRRIITYSTFNENCDYYARNIEDFGNRVKFQIVCKLGVFDAMLNMQGIHNVSNAVGVFACGIEAGIPPYKIIAGLTHYKPEGDKQNLLRFNGYNMIVDTYSATPISVNSAMQMLSTFPVEEGVRKIAVLGDIPALGDFSVEKHKEVGEQISGYNFDCMLCVGDESRYFAEAAVRAGKQAYHYEDREAFNRKLSEVIHPGDLILFKSGTRSHLKEETIYPLFGLIDK